MALQLVQQQSMTLNQEAITEWIEYREFKKKALSQFALNKSIKFLNNYEHQHQQHIVDMAIMNDWTGLHQVEEPKNKPQVTGDTSWIDSR